MTTPTPSAAPGGPPSPLVRGSGPGLLLAHGAGGGALPNYGRVIDALARDRTVVAPDYPGSGTTPRAADPLTLDGLADAVVAAAVGAGLPAFAVHGYSLGGAVAVRAAVRHPDRVTALVLTAAFAAPSPAFRALLRDWRAQIAAEGAPDHAPGAADQVDLVLRADVRADLPRVAVPTLVVATTADTLVDPAHSAELAAGIPGAARAGLDAGHLVWEDAPDAWAGLITGFLAGADPVPAGRP
ncbi:alpha/beta fold hydrolase [Nocardiopsis trehalosi]|jgi:pimeloyl-ACP methyl ester carboxylesterase|uniref:alpha/beta fold hydrolase n=1 Tax=Nocardiopsis trehalosi TaxID=109329 RepID=UPI000831CE1A|nr:alpha/beta fold hydrolase [Nocardiopsis trehalosi]